tara:strand:+ start:1250 stop:2500 length:1251 start_codon:yes stop_codon:yes gene_type:complete
MATANTFGNPAGTVGTLNGLFKETYADKLQELIPDGVKLLNKIKFMAKGKQPGNLYHQPVILGMEHGVTFASSDEDAFNLNPPVAGQIKDAQIKGNPLIMRSLLGYVAASRAAQGGQQAFMDATKFLVANMLRSMAKKLEIEMLYGQIGYATVASNSTTAITITTAEWAPGIWAGAEGMPIEIRDTTGATSKGEFTVTSVNLDTRVVTVSVSPGVLVAGDVIWHKGAYGNEFPGIHKVLTQSTGSLFNIDVAAYNLWRGNTFSASSAALSFNKLTLAASRAVEKGQDGRLLALVNPRAWANMLNDQAALRKYDSSYSAAKVENGSKSILFHSQNGDIEIEPSIYVKEGYAYLLSLEDWFRVGSQDMSFKRPGQDTDFFRDLENSAAYELRLYTDQAVFCVAPGRQVLINAIVNLAS